MADFYAVKHLAGSDLGWFRALFRKFSNTGLKGINLNASPTTTVFYRDLAALAARTGDRVRVETTIFGPNSAGAYGGTFKVVRSEGSKNWRLNGTLVSDPVGEEHRFDNMVPGDIAVIAFDGRGVPDAIRLVLLSQHAAADREFWTYFRDHFRPRGMKTMFEIEPAEIGAALSLPGVDPHHPLSLLVVNEAEQEVLEDAGLGAGTEGSRIRRRGGRRRTMQAEVEAAKRIAAITGAFGEALVDVHLRGLPGTRHEWVSRHDAFSPFDFLIDNGDGPIKADAKSTTADFGRRFHMSLGEVEDAAASDSPYVIYRLFRLTDDGATLRISEDIRPFALRLLAAHDASMFEGVFADGFSIPPAADGLRWGDEIPMHTDDGEDLDLPEP